MMLRFVLLLILSVSQSVLGYELFSETLIRAVSEPMAIKSFSSDFNDHLNDGEIAWTRNRVRMGARYDSWSLAYIQNFDYNIHFNNSTTLLYYLDKNDLVVPVDRVYPIDLKAWQLRSQGLQLGKNFIFSSNWQLELRVNFLQGMAFQDGSLKGSLLSNSETYNGKVVVDYKYSDDKLFEHHAEPSSGEGLSLDVIGTWEDANSSVTFAWFDAAGFMDWGLSPYTLGLASTIGREVSDALTLEPVFSGFRGVDNYRQHIPGYIIVSYQEQLDGVALKVDGEYFLSGFSPSLGLCLTDVIARPYIGYEFHDEQILMGASGDYWQLQLGSDEWKLNKARSFMLALSVSLPF